MRRRTSKSTTYERRRQGEREKERRKGSEREEEKERIKRSSFEGYLET